MNFFLLLYNLDFILKGMPLIEITSHQKSISPKSFKTISIELAKTFDTPPETIRFIWRKVPKNCLYNWGELAGASNLGPIIQISYRDRLSKSKTIILYKQLTKFLATKLRCNPAEVIIFSYRLQPGDVSTLGRIWMGGNKFERLN